MRIKGKEAILTADGVTEDRVACNELVVVAEFGEPIYPGFRRLGSIDRGGDKPAHVVIKGENYHALEALRFSHAGLIDCIYIDPPYNTGARDWKYDNDYVDAEDGYRHSKWLAFMERRLLLARDLLSPAEAVLVVSIDEKEYLRLGLLLNQVFPDARIQMVSTLVNPAVVSRPGAFGRSDEYVYFVMVGDAAPQRQRLSRDWVSSRGRTHTGSIRWDMLRRSGPNASRADRPTLFYPIYVDPKGPTIVEVGEPLGDGSAPPLRKDAVAVLPIRKDGSEGNWQAQPSTLRSRIGQGRVRVTGDSEKGFTISVLKDGEFQKIQRGEYRVVDTRADGSVIVERAVEDDTVLAIPGTQWRIDSHDATQYGSRLLSRFLPGSHFPFPKSLYAVEDCVRFFVKDKPDAVVLDFFAGSGTTAHAVARLNRQDGGRRQSILVTNNEVSADEAHALAASGALPGDEEWEAVGIFELVTRPRLEAAMSGRTPSGEPVKGNYKFTDEFPMAEGLEENVEFLELKYLDIEDVELDLAFESVAPLLWLRAGGAGPVIDRRRDGSGAPKALDLTDTYGVLFDPDHWRAFVERLPESVTTVFVVTDSPSVFASIVAELPSGVDVVRLYENYLSTFSINRRR
ncbi:MAG: DNA methyltransferase [Ilumatobacteraceae bacterium]